MSLREPSTLTESKQAANRANAQRSTGPRTAEGQARSSRNALKHGIYADVSAEGRATMLALGEDREEFEQLHAELRAAYEVDDAIADALVADLAKLYWRQRRWERASDGLLRAERKRWEMEQESDEQGRRYESATIAREQFAQFGLRWSPDAPAKFRRLVELLEMLRERVARRDFAEDLGGLFDLIYGNRPLWRGQMLWFLWRALHGAQQTGKKLPETMAQLLEKELEEEMATLRGEAERTRAARAELAPAERDAVLMPPHPHAVWLAEQGHKLDRAIDRKIRLLILYQKQKARQGTEYRVQVTGPKQEARSQKPEGKMQEEKPAETPAGAARSAPSHAAIKIEETKPQCPLESTKPAMAPTISEGAPPPSTGPEAPSADLDGARKVVITLRKSSS